MESSRFFAKRRIKESRIQVAFEIETDYKYDLKRAKVDEYSKQKKNLHYKTQNLFARNVKIKAAQVTINVNSTKNKSKKCKKVGHSHEARLCKSKKKKRKININTGIKGSMLIEPYLHLAQIMIQVHMKVKVQVVPVAMIVK